MRHALSLRTPAALSLEAAGQAHRWRPWTRWTTTSFQRSWLMMMVKMMTSRCRLETAVATTTETRRLPTCAVLPANTSRAPSCRLSQTVMWRQHPAREAAAARVSARRLRSGCHRHRPRARVPPGPWTLASVREGGKGTAGRPTMVCRLAAGAAVTQYQTRALGFGTAVEAVVVWVGETVDRGEIAGAGGTTAGKERARA